jgi:hypothetical protein
MVYFAVGLGDLTDKLGPPHVHGAIDLAGFRSRSMRRSPTCRLFSLNDKQPMTAWRNCAGNLWDLFASVVRYCWRSGVLLTYFQAI